MNKKLWFLVKFSLRKKIATKWFLVVNILLFILIAGLINIDSIIKTFGGDFNKPKEIIVLDNTKRSYEIFKNNYEEVAKSLEDMSKYNINKYDKSESDAIKEVEENKKILIVFESDKTNIISMKIITQNTIDTITYQIIVSSASNTKYVLALEDINLSQEKLAMLNTPINIERIFTEKDAKNKDDNMELIMSTIFPIFILPFFILSIFLIQMIGAEVNEEKATKSMEIIISNVSPKIHLFSKMIAGNIFVLFQGIILIVAFLIGLLIRLLTSNKSLTLGFGDLLGDTWTKIVESGFIDKLSYVIPLTLILIILGFIGYSLLAGILASMTTNMEDFQQLQTPIIIISVVSYYLSIMAGLFEGSLFIQMLSYVPFISIVLAPALLMIGQTSIMDMMITIFLMVGVIFLLYKYGLKVYKVGILNYSSSKLWRKMIKAAKS